MFDSNAARIFLRYKTEQQLNNRRRECLLPTGKQEYPHHMYDRAQKITMVLRNQPSPRPSGSRIRTLFKWAPKSHTERKRHTSTKHTQHISRVKRELWVNCYHPAGDMIHSGVASRLDLSQPPPPPQKRNRPRHHYTYILNSGTGKQSLSSDMTPRARYINATPGRALLPLGINHQIIVLCTPSQRALPASSQR